MSSISQTDGSFRQNHKELDAYQRALAADELPLERGFLLGREDKNRRALVMEIMCRSRVDFTALSRRLGFDTSAAYAAEIASLADLAADGLVKVDAEGFEITPTGELFRRIIAMRFDEYLARGPRKFSKTV
jgi:oxygen-independent coproporphyrinogen-3 oxidase